MSALTLPLDANAHNYKRGSNVLCTKNATSSSLGEYSYRYTCSDCGSFYDALAYTFKAKAGDMNGDDRINIEDVSVLTNYLRDKIPYSALSCGGDLDEDGICSVTDLTYLLNKLAGKN